MSNELSRLAQRVSVAYNESRPFRITVYVIVLVIVGVLAMLAGAA